MHNLSCTSLASLMLREAVRGIEHEAEDRIRGLVEVHRIGLTDCCELIYLNKLVLGGFLHPKAREFGASWQSE